MSEPLSPGLRIGDTEREQAVDLLRDHMAAGRLEHAEFDERLGTALTAHTQAELDALFTDLPGPRPGQVLAVPSGASTPSPFETLPDEEAYHDPWWTHWGLFVLAWLLTIVSRGRLGMLIPLAGVWVWWLGPSIASSMHQAQRRAVTGRHPTQQALRQQGRDLRLERRELHAQQRDLRQRRREFRDERRRRRRGDW